MAFFLTQFYFQIIVKRKLNPNKADLFEGSFSWGKGEGEGGSVGPPLLPPVFKFQEELIQYQYNFIELLNNLFKVC